MAYSTTERPNRFCMSKNEIRYCFTVTELARPGLYFQIKLMAGANELVLPPLKPNADGKVIVYLQQYIDSYLTYNIPFLENFTNANNQWINFFVATREVTNAIPNPEFIQPEASHVRTALKMGIEKNRYGRNNFFNYYGSKLMFLTWQPMGRTIAIDEPLFLTAFFPNFDTTNFFLKVNYQCTDGTYGALSIALTGGNGFIYHCKTDVATLGLTAAVGSKKLYWYEVSVEVVGNDTGIMVNGFRFYIDYTKRYRHHDFIYINSLGGVDTARAVGEVTTSIERDFEIVEGGFTANEWNTTIKGHDSFYTGITQRRNYKGDMGFRATKEEQYAMIELLLSQYIYQIIDSRLVPILALQKSQAMGKNTDKIQSFAIEWTLAETNETFTPQHIALGLGSDTETY